MYKLIFLLLCFLGTTTSVLMAQSKEVALELFQVMGKGESRDEMESLMLQRARNQAIETGLGVQVSSREQTFKSELLTKRAGEKSAFEWIEDYVFLSQHESGGKIIEESLVQFKLEVVDGQAALRLNYKAQVMPNAGKSDPSFMIKFGLNRSSYEVGDSIIMSLFTTKDASFYLFQVDETGFCHLIWPNQYDCFQSIPRGKEIFAPVNSAKYAFLAVIDEPNRRKVRECVYAIAVKDQPTLFECGDAGNLVISMIDLNRMLIKIPRDKREEACIVYSISKRP